MDPEDTQPVRSLPDRDRGSLPADRRDEAADLMRRLLAALEHQDTTDQGGTSSSQGEQR